MEFQLVRRPLTPTPTQQADAIVQTVTARENFLTKALITILSINVFLLSGAVSFCVFTFLYPS